MHPFDVICSYRWLQMVCSWCFSSSTNSWRALMWPCVVMANLAYLIRKNNNDIMPLNPSLWPKSWHWFNRFILFLYNYLTANILHPSKNDYWKEINLIINPFNRLINSRDIQSFYKTYEELVVILKKYHIRISFHLNTQ